MVDLNSPVRFSVLAAYHCNSLFGRRQETLHGFGRDQSESTDRALVLMKAFVARKLSARAASV